MKKKFNSFNQGLIMFFLLFISSAAVAQSAGSTLRPNTDAVYNNMKSVLPGPASELQEESYIHEDPNIPHELPFSGACVPGTSNRFSGSWHSNMYIGNNNGSNALLAWGQNMSLYITGAGTDFTSPTVVSSASYSGIPYEVKSTSSGAGTGLSVLALRTSTNLYIFGTAANITGVTTMAGFGGATITTAASNVTAKLPAGVSIGQIVEMELSQTAFAIVTNTGNVYVLTTIANLQGDQAAGNAAIWHHVTLTGGVTSLTGVTKLSLSGSGVLACTSTNKLYYWGSPANVAGVANTVTSYNYAFDMSAQIPATRIVKDVVCLGTKTGPSTSTLFILCNNRKVYACGVNAGGCLGINNATVTFNQATFITVKTTDGLTDLTGIVKIDGDTEGDVFCMGAIDNVGHIFGWGNSPAGMLGVNAAVTDFAVPKTTQLFVSPAPGSGFNDFSVAGHFIIAFYSHAATDEYWYLGHNISGSVGIPSNVTTFILAAAPANLGSTGGITYDCSSVFLPLTWLNFDAQKQASSVLLNWSTATEQNTVDFLLQHSTDGTVWQTISTVPAAGNSSSTEHYSFVHTSPAKGINYYRLLQRDMDGNSSYSKTVSVLFTSGVKELIISPNEIVNGILNLQLQEATMIYVYNSTGMLVIRQQFDAGRQILNTANLAKGVYMLKAGTETEKFIIQ